MSMRNGTPVADLTTSCFLSPPITKLFFPCGRLTSCVTTLFAEILGVPFDSNPSRLELFKVILNRVSSRFTEAFSTFMEKPNPVNFVTS